MKIDYKNYKIESDPYCWILRVFWFKQDIPKWFKKVKQEWVKEIVELDTRFYPSILSCFMEIRQREIKKRNTITDIEQYIEELKKIDEEIVNNFNLIKI